MDDVKTRQISRTMTSEECTALLSLGGVGRVGIIVSGRPHILPVNYRAVDDVVVFRTAEGTMLNDVALRQVAFEADGLDFESRTGWSVVVHGYGRDISDGIDRESTRLRALPIDCWAPGDRDRWYKIVPWEVTGRRLYREEVSETA